MMETISPSKTFLGVRFVLLGFEAIHKQKIRSKLVSGGGVDVGQYNQNCTHVIVDKLVFDDPACVAARRDGKMVVTAIWVDHSYDVGMPLDAASIMYRPRKDLDGIPGAKDLIMCLTGYQRQDRDDIMTMVGLMGAQFSKPLVANKVTHLICYKFEGEKYELAKRMKKIKLVNHRWLEDCLREWEILPEANYEKSGYELEMMEAEAKDSEEEDEGTAVKQYGGKSISRSPNNVKTGMTKAHELPLTFGKGSKFPDASTSEIVPDAVNAKEVLRTPVKDERSVSAKLNDIDVSGALGCQDVGAEKVATFSKLPDSSVRTPDSKRVGNDLASTSKTVEMSPPSEMKSALSYSRKTPRRSTLSMYSCDRTSNLSRSPRAQLDEFMINDCSNVFSSKVEQFRDVSTTPCAKSPQKGSKLFSEELNSILPQKRKMDSSSATPVSSAQKTNHDRKPSNSGNVSTDNTSLFYNGLSVGRTGNLAENSQAPISATKSPSDLHLVQTMTGQIDNIDGKLQETTFERSEMLTSDGKAGTSDFLASISADIVHDKGEAVDQQQDVDISYYSSKRTEGEISHNPLQLDLPKEVSGNVKTKPLRQKTVAKKTLGSRPKLCKSANRKGSIYVNEAATQNEVAICVSGGKERADLEKSSDADKHVVSSPTLIVDAVKEVVDNKAESIDDETEAPDDKYDHDFGKTIIEVDTIMKEQSDEVHVKTSDLNYTMPRDITALEKTTNNVETKKADCGKNLELGESVCKVDASTERTKRKKRPRGNTKIKSAPAVKEDGKSMNETMMEKGKGVSRPTAKTKESTVLADLNDTMPPAITALEKVTNQAESENADVVKNLEMERSTSTVDTVTEKNKSKKRLPGNKTKTKSAPAIIEIEEIKEDGQNMEETEMEKERKVPQLAGKTKKSTVKRSEKSMTVEKENKPVENAEDTSQGKDSVGKSDDKSNRTPIKTEKSNPNSVQTGQILSRMKSEPVWFILSGHRFQRKEFQQVIRRLKGKVCRDSHQWSYQATHFIAPDPIRRTEKFFAAAASGRWILKMDYLTACNQAGKFLAEEPYEWHKIGLSEDGAINLEAPRKWRLLRERTGHGAFYGMRIIIYGECIAPPLDTLKRVVKAGDGTILATSPPYNRFLNSGVDFAIVSPGMPRVDMWVQEFLRHEIPCVVADYLVEYVCKPGYSLEKHVLYNTNAWAKKSFANLQSRAENILEDLTTSSDCGSDGTTCQVCGSSDRGDVMLICGNESGTVGCGVARHIDCCDPPLENVPEEDWFCRDCCRKGNSSNLSDKSKNRKSSSKKKRRS